MKFAVVVIVVALVVPFSAVGCSSSSSTEPVDGAASKDAAAARDGMAAGDPNQLVGSFQVSLIGPKGIAGMAETPGYTSVLGKIGNGPTPAQILWVSKMTEGGCQLLTPKVPFCSTPCGGSAACVGDDKCQDYAIGQDVGTVIVKGVATETGATEFMMTAVGHSYQPTGVMLPYPAFAEGAEISVSTGGGAYAPFTVKSKGIAPLVLTNRAPKLQNNEAVTFTWNPPAKSDVSKIHVKLDLSHHGGTKGQILCDVADTGSLTLSAAMMTALIKLGVAGFPSVVVTRKAVGSTVIAPGRVDLTVSQDVEQIVSVAGFIDCTADAECPTGQTCQNDLTCK
jgi:hypothetical protein